MPREAKQKVTIKSNNLRGGGGHRSLPPAPLPTTTTTTHSSSSLPTFAVMLPVHVVCHWRELPQVSFLSCQNGSFVATKVCLPCQNFCRDKIMFVATKYFCHNKSSTCLSQQKFCHDKHTFCCDKKRVLSQQTHVVTKVSFSQQNYVCRGKYLSEQKYVCHDKCFVVASILLS